MEKYDVVFLGDSINEKEIFGIQRYAYELLQKLDALNFSLRICVLIPENGENYLPFDSIKIVKYGKNKGAIWRQIDFPVFVKKAKAIGVDLTLGIPVFGRYVIAIHDCIIEEFPEDFCGLKAKLKRLWYMIRVRMSVQKSLKIITVSNYSRNKIVEHYGIRDDKIVVIPNAWQHMEKVIPDNSILDELNVERGNYYFTLGSVLPHKNIKWIISAAEQNKNEMFVVTGSSKFYEDFKQETSNVLFTGYISDEKIKALMMSCKQFLFPSLSEGFGIPPLEALSCGADISISNASCLPEIYSDSATYFNPTDYSIDINQLIGETSETNKQRVLDKYSWEKSAMLLIRLLESVVENN